MWARICSPPNPTCSSVPPNVPRTACDYGCFANRSPLTFAGDDDDKRRMLYETRESPAASGNSTSKRYRDVTQFALGDTTTFRDPSHPTGTGCSF
eukprot:1128715-Pyramimonas_sp.AAC.1